MKRNRSYGVLIAALIVAIIGMSIGFALSDINITVEGADVTTKAAALDVHINSVTGDITGTAEVDSIQIVEGTKNLKATYSVELKDINDAYDFDIEVINAGSIDAKLKQIKIDPVSNSNISHTVTYNSSNYTDATNNITGTTLKTNDTETIHVEVKYLTALTIDNVAKFTVTLVYGEA